MTTISAPPPFLRLSRARFPRYGAALLLALLMSPLADAQPSLDLAQYKGKVVYLDFWASWCGPCRQSFPWMNELLRKYAGDGLEVVAVNVDENSRDAETFLKDVPARFHVIFDPKGQLAESYQVPGMPTSILIDQQGHVRAKRIGFRPDEQAAYETQVRQLLAEKRG